MSTTLTLKEIDSRLAEIPSPFDLLHEEDLISRQPHWSKEAKNQKTLAINWARYEYKELRKARREIHEL